MKLAFISDIHGNATALDAVLQDIKNKNVDKVYDSWRYLLSRT